MSGPVIKLHEIPLSIFALLIMAQHVCDKTTASESFSASAGVCRPVHVSSCSMALVFSLAKSLVLNFVVSSIF